MVKKKAEGWCCSENGGVWGRIGGSRTRRKGWENRRGDCLCLGPRLVREQSVSCRSAVLGPLAGVCGGRRWCVCECGFVKFDEAMMDGFGLFGCFWLMILLGWWCKRYEILFWFYLPHCAFSIFAPFCLIFSDAIFAPPTCSTTHFSIYCFSFCFY